MSSTLALLLQITATNGAAGVLGGLRKTLVDMGRLGKESAKHFDAMTRSLQRAGNSFAASIYITGKLKPGVQAAADLEEAMNRVKGNIAQTTDKAGDLAAKLAQVRQTAREVSKVMPYSAKEVVDIQGSLLKAGVDVSAVVGSRGAAYSAAGLASVAGVAPDQVGDMLARIGKQYDFKPTDYKSAADLLMKGEAASPGSLQELMYSLRQSGATSKLLGISFKDSVTMSAAMAPLGLEAGTAVNRYILDSAGLTQHQREAMLKLGLGKMHDGKFENLLYKNGKYIGLDAQNAMVSKKFSGIKDDNIKLKLAHDIWGQEGMRAALMVGAGNNIFADMQKQMDVSLGLEERMKIAMGGFNMSAKAAAGTVQTLLATAFTPVLAKATALSDKVNDIADSGAQWLDKHPVGNNMVAAGGGALALGAAGYGLWHLAKGGISGMKMLRGVGGTAAGIATGKAVEAATGVTPVFVTNWPGNMGGGIAGALTTAGEATAAAAGGSWLAAAGRGISAALLGGSAFAATVAAAAGWLIGTETNNFINEHDKKNGTSMGEDIGRWVAFLMAGLGDKDAERALEINLNLDGEQIANVVNRRTKRESRRH